MTIASSRHAGSFSWQWHCRNTAALSTCYMLPKKRDCPQRHCSCWCTAEDSCMPTNWRGTCARCTVAVPTGTSMLNTATCVVKCFRGWSACTGVPSASAKSQLTGQAVTTRTITITQLHLTAQILPRTCLHPPGSATWFGYMSSLATACGTAKQACSLIPADHTATTNLPFRVQSAKLCFAGQSVEKRPEVCSRGIPTATLIVDY